MSASDANNKFRRTSGKKFKNLMEERMFDCQGDNSKVSAHMSCKLVPTNLFYDNLRPDLNPDFKNDPKFKKICKSELGKFHKFHEYYKSKYDITLKADDLPIIICEGTGEFNAVNQHDKVAEHRERLFKYAPVLKNSKYKIYHPIGDPKQFYLNMISMIVPKFIKEYQYPLSTFVLCYNVKSRHGGNKMIYGVTYNDFVERKPFSIVPRKQMTPKEMNVVHTTCRKTIRQSAIRVNKGEQLDSYVRIASKVDNLKNVFNLYNTSSIRTKIGGGGVRPSGGTYDELYYTAVKMLIGTQKKINNKLGGVTPEKIRGRTYGTRPSPSSRDDDVKIYFTLQPYVVASRRFNKDLIRGLTRRNVGVTKLDYFCEVFGENVRNIVLVVSMKK